jgi:hypothetical protein
VGGSEPPRDAPRREEPAGASATYGAAVRRARRDVARACESGDSEDSVSLLTELDAFFTEHGRCGDLDAGVEGEVVWIACDCGARMARQVDEDRRLN